MALVDLKQNAFWYVEGSAVLRHLISTCRTSALECWGVPPLGCTVAEPV